MTPAHKALLRLLEPRSGEWNWYQVSRAWVSRYDPTELDLQSLVDRGLIEEVPHDGEPLPRLVVTETGKAVLSKEDDGVIDA